MNLRYPSVLGLVLLFSWLFVGGGATGEAATATRAKAANSAANGSGQAKTLPLPQDPALRTGKLRNGLRYAIYPNKQPEGRASLRLVVKAGSFHETEAQRGLAHYLEHMAFSGSTHYPPGALSAFFQRMGMRFGADTNAFTSFDRTIYVLELPQTDKATLAEAFQVFSDYAGGLLLLDEEIERERAVILSEKRERDSAAYRSNVAHLEFMLGDSLLPKRLPIGEEAVIRSANRDQLLDFWNTWYRPERMTVVAVGDFDAKKVESQIRKAFARLKARAPARPEPDLGTLTRLERARILYYYEPEAPATTIRMTNINPYRLPDIPTDDSPQKRVLDLILEVTVEMLNRRFMALSKEEGAPFLAARVVTKEEFGFYRETALQISTRAEQWREALALGSQELRRVQEYGFRPDELAVVVAELKTEVEAKARSAANRSSSTLANEIAEALHTGTVVTHPHFDYALYTPFLDHITVEQCNGVYPFLFGKPPGSGQGLFISVSGNAVIEEAGKTPREVIRAVGLASEQVALEPLVERKTSEWAYADWGAPGSVVSDDYVEDLDLRLVRFANGVRLNFKKTSFEPGLIRVWSRVGEGRITEPEGMQGIGALAETAFNLGGLGAHSVEDLGRIFAGRSGGARFRLGDDAFILDAQLFPRDLQMSFQAIAAQLTDPGWRPEALRQTRRMIEQMYLSLKHTPNGPLATEVASLLLGGDSRFTMPEESVLLSRTMDEVRDWLGPQLAQGPLEVTVVGDVEAPVLIGIVAETLGALPPRAERRDLSAVRQVRFPDVPFNKSYRIPTQIDKGEVRVYWPATDGMDGYRARQLSLLNSVLEQRVREQVRQQMGASYSPSTAIRASLDFPGYGFFEVGCTVDPSQAQQVVELIVKIGDDLAQHGVTQAELSRSRKQLLTAVRQLVRNNRHWLVSLSKAQEQPETLDFTRSVESDFEAITAEELSTLASEYLGGDRASRVVILPER